MLAGLTVAAVALPLALAFGVASGASAGAGLVTAILSGFIIGGLSGAPYQISGPTGAMSAVLILLAGQYGLTGIWITGLISGVLMILIGIFRMGRFISYIPAPVITGFTSGIALIIFIGQIDNLLGIKTPSVESSLMKFAEYFHGGYNPNFSSLLVGLLVIAIMVFWPQKWNLRFPSSLFGIIVATLVTIIFQFPVQTIGEIPRSLVLTERLALSSISLTDLSVYLAPAITITALGAIESLLCGTVASNMTGIRLYADQELISQGVGNFLIPFFGGVPATAAIARTSVGIKAGGQTRLVSIAHSLVLLLSMFLLSPVMQQIPLPALAGVLMVTAWRMNEWKSIRFIFTGRFKSAIAAFLITMMATITFDLTQAILVGSMVSAAFFLNQLARIKVDVQDVSEERLKERGVTISNPCPHIRVAFVSGPLFFASTDLFNEAFISLTDTHVLILSVRGMPLIDTAGLEVLERLQHKIRENGGYLMLAGVQGAVKAMLERSGLIEEIGRDKIFWSADQAIVAADDMTCLHCSSGNNA